MAALPFAVTPSRSTTDFKVRKRMEASRARDRWSTYSTSSSNFRDQDKEFLPLTCASPVTPGRTSCLRFSNGEYRLRYRTRRGRGPTMLMSPLITFHRVGSSSMLVDRKIRPNFVSRSSSVTSRPSSDTFLIVRNLRRRKICPLSPGRSCLNRIGRPNFAMTAPATRSWIGAVTTSAADAPTRSRIRFVVSNRRCSCALFTLGSLLSRRFE